MTAPFSLAAQQPELLRGVVRSTVGDSVPGARVHAVATGVDTIVRTDRRGRFSVLLPRGQARLIATMLGFAADSLRVTVTDADTAFTLRLRRLPQQLARVDVLSSAWTGVRGVVGDERTMEPLAGVVITSMKRDIRVVTDSLVRFEFPLPKAELTSLQLTQTGYISRATALRVIRGDTAPLLLLMKRGRDPTYLRFALSDLSHRMAWAGTGVLIANRAQISRNGGTTLEDGIFGSGLISSRGIRLTVICLFVNGEPQPGRPLWSIDLADVDFLEVWDRGTERFGSFKDRWPGGKCGGGTPGRGGDGPWVSVWLTN